MEMPMPMHETTFVKKNMLPLIIGFPILFLTLCASVYANMLILFSALIAACIIVLALAKKPVNLIYFQIGYLSIIRFTQSGLRGPEAATYFTDLINVVLIAVALVKLFEHKKKVGLVVPLSAVLVLFLITVIGYMQNRQSILLYLWGFRNNFRFYGFFFACAVLLKRENVDTIFKFLMGLLGANFIVCSYQYFFQGMKMDNLGGLFGTDTGCNGYMNILICIVSVIVIVRFIHKDLTVTALIFTLVVSTYIAVISELKVYFIEMIIIILCAVLFSKPGGKSVLLVACAGLMLFVGVQMVYLLFPSFNDFFNLSSILSSSSHYATGTDLGRFTACSSVTAQFFGGNSYKLLFGLGLGSAETSQFGILNSAFYAMYGLDLHYTWLSDAFMLIENGWLGLIFFEGFFVSVFCCATVIKKRAKSAQRSQQPEIYCIIAQIVSLLCVLISIYDSSLRTEAGYFAYFILAAPFVVNYEGDLTSFQKASTERLQDQFRPDEAEADKDVGCTTIGCRTHL
jgi:hypothetical protein